MGWKRGWKKIKGTHPARFKRVWIKKPTPKPTRRAYGASGIIGPAVRFTWGEAACKDGSAVPQELRSIAATQGRLLNKLRKNIAKHYRVPFNEVRIDVTSWYRTPKYNQKVGGASNSQHLQARATDITVMVKDNLLTPQRVAELAESVPAFRRGGIGWYDKKHGNFTHLDHRSDGPARWVNG